MAKEPRLREDMGALQKKMPGCGLWGLILLAGAAMLGSGIGASAAAPRSRPAVANLWESAVRARAVLEAEPKSRHTRAEYARVIAAFRMVYYDNPADAHAARAAEQVAEVLTEEGHELDDRKVLREAAAQYAFVAKAYPPYKTPAYRAGRREDAVPPREESRPAGGGATAPAPVGSAYQRREVGHPAVAAAAVPVVPAEVATVTGIRCRAGASTSMEL